MDDDAVLVNLLHAVSEGSRSYPDSLIISTDASQVHDCSPLAFTAHSPKTHSFFWQAPLLVRQSGPV